MTDPHVVIADSGPLISLAAINELHLLQQLFGRVTIPQAVWTEVVLDKPHAPGAHEVATATFIDIETVDDAEADALQANEGLGRGEAEAIVLAKRSANALLVLDDLKARIIVDALGLRRVGTAGVLLRARRSGLIDRLRPRLEALVRNGTYLSQHLIVEFLRQVGE